MSGLPEIRHIVGEWIARAEEDLSAAELLLSQPGTWPLRSACFHAQQCIEKYLKALLTSLSHPFSKTHDVAELLSSVSAGTDLGLKVAELDRVNRYGVEARYPGDWEPITRADAEEAVKIARATKNAVRAHIGKELL